MVGVFLRIVLLALALPVVAAAADSKAPPAEVKAQAPQLPPVSETGAVDFDLPQPLLDLGPSVSPRRITVPGDESGAWFTVGAQNRGSGTVARVLAASEPAAGGLELKPMTRRPALIEAASSDPDVVIESTTAFGENAFRVLVPPGKATTLALHFEGVGARPSLLAWTEAALIAHNRQIAILSGGVAGLLAAALAFAAGAAALSGRIYARWAALFLGALLVAELASIGALDGTVVTRFGGPYGLFALALAVALAAAIRLVDHIAAFEALMPGAHLLRDSFALALLVTGAAGFLALPVAGAAIRLVAPFAAAAAAGYLAPCGRIGIAGARRLAPAATIFALVTAAAVFNALGVFGANLVAPFAIGGFSAAGALLVALAIAVPTEPAMERLREFEEKHKGDDEQATVTDESLEQVRELAAVAASHQGVFDLDMETGLVSLSAEGAAILGLPTGAVELSKDIWLARIHPDDRQVYQEALDTYRHRPGVAFRLEFRARASGSRTAWLELRATMTGQSTEAERCLGLIADVTARKNAETSGLHPGETDALTGLGNRLALIGHLESLGDEFETTALAVFDLDRFKAVNDSLGREGGDTLLRSFAERLEQGFAAERKAARAMSFRIGGDMFAVILRGAAKPADFGERIIDLASVPFAVADREIYLPTSVGVAKGAKAEDAQELISQAELAMVEAKREGGERVCVYHSALAQTAPHDPIALESDLRRALERDEFEVHYQPIVRLKDGSVAGFEALLRWRNPERGFVEPDSFVPQAERSGLIVPLGRLVLKRAAEDLARWQQFFPAKPPLFLDVNVTWRQIADKSFASELESLLKTAAIAKRSLRLEVTESAVMAGADKAEAALKRLKALGAGLAIDDFGTGHSSLSHLSRFPFDVIKIDKSFIAAAHEKEGAAILGSIIHLAHDLERPAVAEGVEKGSEATLLREMGCEYGQGYFFGAPMPASEIVGYISTALAR